MSAWPLVGREHELAQIDEARTDPASTGVVLVGEAGVGKSRVAREVRAAAEADGAQVEWAQATRSAAAVPLGAFALLVPDEVRADDLAQTMRLSAQALRERAAGREVLLVVDDAQLLDPASAALVLHLATTGTAFVVATARAGERLPDAIEALWKDGGARRIELGTLAEAETRALVEAALEGPVEEAALRWAVDVSGCNALYVRELVTGAVDSGALAPDGGLWRLSGVPRAPGSLIELVGGRLAGLTDAQRAAVELLALGEPLRPGEVDEGALVELEALGLVAAGEAGAGLAHPVYGEVVRAELPPLRARGRRLALAEALRAREPFGAEEALRVARLLLDAGAELPSELRLEAARAANLAGDPDLGAALVAADGGGLDAAMVLAQAHAMRGRYADAEAALAAVEPLAAEDGTANEYLRRRTWIQHWGLRDRDALEALLARARGWQGGRLARMTDRLEHVYAPAMALADAEAFSREPGLDDEARRLADAQYTLSLFTAGRADEAAVAARAFRPAAPVRDLGDTAQLGVLSLVCIESGNDWEALQQSMERALRDGVRAGDHRSAGIAAYTIARLAYLGGRYPAAARWLAEALVHFERDDPLGVRIQARALDVGLAWAEGDHEVGAERLERLRASVADTELLPIQVPHVRRAEGWALRLRSDAEAARRLLRDAEDLDETPCYAAPLAYEALRAGAIAAPYLESLARRCDSRLVRAYAAHATGKAAHDGGTLLATAEEMAAIGALRYAVEAAADAASTYVREGRQDSARRAAARVRELFGGQGGTPPGIDGLDGPATELTRRERQITELVAQGLSNAEVAERLVLSVRTVETHLYRAMGKLGVSDRREL